MTQLLCPAEQNNYFREASGHRGGCMHEQHTVSVELASSLTIVFQGSMTGSQDLI